MHKKILVPIDLGDADSATKTLKAANQLPRTADGEMHVLTVVPTYGMSIVGSYFDESFEAKAMEAGKAALKDFLGASDADVTKGHVAHGSIYEEILAASQKLGADLIVMAAHRPELKDYLLGPNAGRVVRHAKCSVLVVRD